MAPSGLPPQWTTEHDVFICHLDATGHFVPSILAKLREIFPELRREVIREPAIDRRLRMLDMGGKDYFRRPVNDFPWSTLI